MLKSATKRKHRNCQNLPCGQRPCCKPKVQAYFFAFCSCNSSPSILSMIDSLSSQNARPSILATSSILIAWSLQIESEMQVSFTVNLGGLSALTLTLDSVNCSRAKFHDLGSKKIGMSGFLFNNSCNVFPYNGITGLTPVGELVQDVIAVGSVAPLEVGQITTVARFLFSYALTSHLQGLTSGANCQGNVRKIFNFTAITAQFLL
ncbi:hypothetical protein PTKIN_Ptkin02bG0226600 [Pterospermum kingtungense]